MAIQVLIDGPRNAVVKVLGTGTIDVSTLSGSPDLVRIEKIYFSAPDAGSVVLDWDATIDEEIMTLYETGFWDFSCFGGLQNNAGAGVTGDIVVTGTDTTVILHLVK